MDIASGTQSCCSGPGKSGDNAGEHSCCRNGEKDSDSGKRGCCKSNTLPVPPANRDAAEMDDGNNSDGFGDDADYADDDGFGEDASYDGCDDCFGDGSVSGTDSDTTKVVGGEDIKFEKTDEDPTDTDPFDMLLNLEQQFVDAGAEFDFLVATMCSLLTTSSWDRN